MTWKGTRIPLDYHLHKLEQRRFLFGGEEQLAVMAAEVPAVVGIFSVDANLILQETKLQALEARGWI